MPKWVRKVQSLGITPNKMRERISPSTLEDVIAQSHRAIDDLQFLIDHTSFEGQLTLDVDGLTLAETFCRDVTTWREREESFPDEQVDPLIALFVGQVFVHNKRGNWAVYPGKYYVPHPVVIELAESPNHYIQPFLYCSNMRMNLQVRGAQYNKSLKMLYENPKASSTR